LKNLLVVGTGTAVLVAIVAMLFAAAYLRGGHPPASGVIILLLLLVLTPAAGLAAVKGLLARGENPGFYVMTGVCLAFTVFAATLLLLKLGLGKTI
jgi:hypothetical protein